MGLLSKGAGLGGAALGGAIGGPVGAGIGAAGAGLLGALGAGGPSDEDKRKQALAALSQKYAQQMNSPYGGAQAPVQQDSGPSAFESIADAGMSGLAAAGAKSAKDQSKLNSEKLAAGGKLTDEEKSGAEVPWYADMARGYLGGR